jgi:hypothetical protein
MSGTEAATTAAAAAAEATAFFSQANHVQQGVQPMEDSVSCVDSCSCYEAEHNKGRNSLQKTGVACCR